MENSKFETRNSNLDGSVSAVGPVAHVFDGGAMDCGSGLILLIRQNMLQVPAGQILEMRSSEPTVVDELPPWCRMTGHEHLASLEESPGRWRHFLRRGSDTARETQALAEDRKKASQYEWRLRARFSPPLQTSLFARNFTWTLGQPASFEEKDRFASALESMLGALAADLTVGFALRCTQRGLTLDDLEATVKARLHSVLAHIGMEEGDPSIQWIDLTLFASSPASGEALRDAWEETKRRSPLHETLRKACAVETRLAIL